MVVVIVVVELLLLLLVAGVNEVDSNVTLAKLGVELTDFMVVLS